MSIPWLNKTLDMFERIKQKLHINQRPAHTLLYITEIKIFRIDCNNKGIIIGDLIIEDCLCESSANIPACLDQLNKKLRLGRKTWLLFSQLKTYSLSLPSVQVTNIDTQILEQALLFEYEALSGESAQYSQLAYQFISEEDEMSTFWLSILAKESYIRIEECLKKHKVKLGGITHPGGLPHFLSSLDASSWLRVECWPKNILALAKTPTSGIKLLILENDHQNWQDELDQWILDIGSCEQTEAIINNKIEYIPQTDDVFRLTQDSALIYWLGLWSKHLITEEINVPIFRHVSTLNKELIYTISSGLLALTLCGGHYAWNLNQRIQFEYQIEQLGQAQKDLDIFTKAVAGSQKKIDGLQKYLKSLDKNVEIMPEILLALQQRAALLLQALAVNSDADLIIEGIQFTSPQLVISGVSLRPHLSNQLANSIEPVLRKLGWKVNSPTKSDMALLTQGGPWSFEIIIEDLGIKGFSNK